MSFLDVLADPEARYMLAYCLACNVPLILSVALYYRIRYHVDE